MLLRVLRKSFLLPNPFDQGANDYWRVRLINAYLLLAMIVLGTFFLLNLFVFRLYANVVVDAVGMIFVLAIIFHYRNRKRIETTSTLVVLNVFLVTFLVVVLGMQDYGTLYWSMFSPLISLFLLGRKKGMIFVSVYYAVLFVYLGSLAGGEISLHELVNFIGVTLVLTAGVYYYEGNRAKAYALIERASIEDPLTGLYNRRHFNTALRRR